MMKNIMNNKGSKSIMPNGKGSKSIMPNGKGSKSIMPNGKKGIILKEVITLVISVLCLIILFYLGSQLYGMLIKKSAFEQAKANVEEISNIINGLKDKGSGTFLLISPKDWFLIIYNRGTTEPASCFEKDCICICPIENPEQCDKGGACKPFDLKIESRPVLKINKFYDLEFKREGDVIKGFNNVRVNNGQR